MQNSKTTTTKLCFGLRTLHVQNRINYQKEGKKGARRRRRIRNNLKFCQRTYKAAYVEGTASENCSQVR